MNMITHYFNKTMSRLSKQLHPCTEQQNLDEEKSKHFGLVQQNDFNPTFLLMMMSYRKAQQSLRPIVDWLNGLIGPNGLLLMISHFFCNLNLVLRVELEKSK